MEEELNTLLGGYGNKFAINFS
ncbi:conserved hypothetical protein [Xenorhabdus bovienii str. kraussei Quebec]|uniref:Uncharacterized protein n=3 Tax=Xenorhabdus bovienii TaxID=40576 RepID=A0A077P4H6_XENBV|nr:conserved hypothetical protein [Xenorhabdus bovienii str. kraussei Quebec]CDH19415.1 conserved hypothetical protein [Xenorhabdus bovienii str. kraussei Quebec]CDH21039.1 conserved hypothetical protein [Xenorhabdus bovienii str. kraussei Quebec]CDH22060.1 conserved hypothetical protein [Xenorhabdus bovienii str. kraussei Quebec]